MNTHIRTHPHTITSCVSGFFGQCARSFGQLALSISLVLSNQHIPLSLVKLWETSLAVHTQGGVTLISCPLTLDYAHTAAVLFCSRITLKTPRTCFRRGSFCRLVQQLSQILPQTLSVCLCLLSATHPVWPCQSVPVVVFHTTTDFPLSGLTTPVPPSCPALQAPLGALETLSTEFCFQQQQQ